ncbi:hypothetical protein CDL15_Pgr019582 [Punica granatum]|uniref:Uncharacterized protein n=1 Tax=Punica granatum TaxID=22663 RepID=A0A218X7F0_PUNGR|nr:hypothetical protein CDL15_Pgr019582 [Punica granatum]PKI38587.1 hypothetical protein CRG98_041020 [Punica granatum]
MGKEGRGYTKGISLEQEGIGTGRTRTSRRSAEQEEIAEAGSLGPLETRRTSRLGRSRGLEEKGGMPDKKKKGREKKRSQAQDQWAGLGPDSDPAFILGPELGLGFARVWVESGIAESARFRDSAHDSPTILPFPTHPPESES